MKQKVLITGITGQDGVFLSSLLLKSNDYQIVGTSRKNDDTNIKKKLIYLGNTDSELDNLKITKCNLEVSEEIEALVEVYKPDYVYNLIGPGSVSESVKFPFQSSNSIVLSYNNLVSSFIQNKIFPKFFQTSSSEMFDDKGHEAISEISNFNPKTPYAISKMYCHNLSNFYKEKFEWDVSIGILFNHESEFRPENYLLTKVIDTARKINKGIEKELVIGSVDLIRDWGFAGDVVNAMVKINESAFSDNYVIGTGNGHSIKNMVEIVFDYFKLDLNNHIRIDSSLMRKDEPISIVADPSKINQKLGWKSKTSFEDTIIRCLDYNSN
tara:strand:- start:12646 stop:13620 length:975 start_codon:yes stop_codon:yes gene_type:complete